MALLKLHDSSGRLVCIVDTDNITIEVKQRGEKEPRRASLRPLLEQIRDVSAPADLASK